MGKFKWCSFQHYVTSEKLKQIEVSSNKATVNYGKPRQWNIKQPRKIVFMEIIWKKNHMLCDKKYTEFW